MHNMIEPGPPMLMSLNRNEYKDTLEARVPCLIDGYAAEYRVEFNTKEQRYSRYTIAMFEPVGLTWHQILSWGVVEVGRMNAYPEDELIQQLRGVGEVMWAYANVVVSQSSRRQEELDIQQYVNERMAHSAALDAELEAETLGDDATELVRMAVEHDAAVNPFEMEGASE